MDRLSKDAARAAGYLAIAIALLAPLSLHPGSRLPDDGDAPQGVWIVWWSANHLFDGRLLDANVYYPHPKGLLYSEPLLVQGLLARPLLALFGEPVLAVNLLTILTFAMSAFAFHLLARNMVGSDRGAALGALVYAFSTYSLSQLARLQLVSLQWLPLALLSLHRFVAGDRKRDAGLFALFSLLHGLSCLYYLSFYALTLAFVLPACLASLPGWRVGLRRLMLLSAVSLPAVLALALLARPYIDLYDRYGFTGEQPVFDLAGFLLPPAGGPLLGGLRAPDAPGGQYFLGYLTLLVGLGGAVVAFRGRRQGRGALWFAYGALGVTAILLAAGPEVRILDRKWAPGLFSYLADFGPFGKLRELVRFSVLTQLALGLFAARAGAALAARLPRRTATLALLSLALLMVGERWSIAFTRGTELPVGARLPPVYRWLADQPGQEPLVELPVRPYRLTRLTSFDALYSTVHQKPTVFGRPSFFPPAYELLQWELRDFPDGRSFHLLSALGVRNVLVHPARWEGRRRGRMLRLQRHETLFPLLRRFAGAQDPVWGPYRIGDEEVRAVAPLEGEGAPRECSCREVERTNLRFDANGANSPELAADGSRATRWTSGADQRGGFFFEIQLDRPRRIARVEVEVAYPYSEFARSLEIVGFDGPEGRLMGPRDDVWHLVSLVRQLVRDPSEARLRYDLEPALVDRLRLELLDPEENVPSWSLPEIHLFELLE